ncbi:MAG: SDR family oxidoreductase [Sphingobacteriales bacterium]|nr:SDR family oxidoreductase [Sphingobacteriales bacterium]
MNILITGANGLLGQKLVLRLCTEANVVLFATGRGPCRIRSATGFTYLEADLLDKSTLERLFEEVRPDCVIHTAAMTDVDACERDPAACQLNNTDCVRLLTELCNANGTHFIHLSTDFVFDGRNGPYREEDPIGPLSEYARSKAAAEEVVREAGIPWTIIRTMIIYGVTDDQQRSNVVLWTKRSLEEGKDIRVISDQYRGPTLAEDLANACATAALNTVTGLFHVSGREVLSILEIAQRTARFFNLDEHHISPVTTEELAQAAKRPLRTGFIISKAEQELNYQPHSLEEGLEIVRSQLKGRQ